MSNVMMDPQEAANVIALVSLIQTTMVATNTNGKQSALLDVGME